MRPDVADVYTRLAAAYAQGAEQGRLALMELSAEEFEYHHDPPLPSDGIVARAQMLEATTGELALFRSAMPDFRIEDPIVSTEGDEIIIDLRMRGTAPDGQGLDLPWRIVTSVVDGRIVRHVGGAGPNADLTVLQHILATAATEAPHPKEHA